jgi:hypothetical protein
MGDVFNASGWVILPCRVDAGKVELDGASYAGLPLPFTLTQLIVSGCPAPDATA